MLDQHHINIAITPPLDQHHTDLNPLYQDHATEPPDNAEPTTTSEKMNHCERDGRLRMFSRKREYETMKREKVADIYR